MRAVEEALYDSRAMRAFVGIDLGCEPVPDETTVMLFRHLLEHRGLGEKIFTAVGQLLQQRGVDARSKVIHSLVTTPVNTADCANTNLTSS